MRVPYAILLALAGLVLLTAPALAEFYKYKDARGVVRFTDNILEVPEDQRDGAAKYKSATPAAQSKAATGKAGVEADPDDSAKQAIMREEDEMSKAQKAESDRLKSIRAELADEYAALTQLKAELQKAREMAVDATAKREVENQIIALNARIKAFEKKSKAFEKELSAYNAKVAE
jgi:hypothetical protein